MAVEQKTWEAMDVVQMVKGQLHEQTSQWYEDRDTYREGAVECYNAHGNPTLWRRAALTTSMTPS